MTTLFDRWYAPTLRKKLARPYVHLLFGARQTGKSTLLKAILPAETLCIDLADPVERTRLLAHPGEFAGMCRALPARPSPQFVFVDEAQAVPAVFDAVQHLYDHDKTRWRFVLCGSSARKLRHAGANLLPGRAMLHHLHPLITAEQPATTRPAQKAQPLVALAGTTAAAVDQPFPAWDIVTRLAFGALPGIVVAAEGDRAALLGAFAAVHLEEEIRREALVKDWGAFVRFLQLAAAESGARVNYAAISREAGVSLPTVKAYYQLLEDMFVGVRIPGFSNSSRKRLLSTPRFMLFDLGVRHAAAGLVPSKDTVLADPGPLFEQWVGLQLWRRLQYCGHGSLCHWHTQEGAEIDFIVEQAGIFTPIEVKWCEHPCATDARHVRVFLEEQGTRAPRGYVVCRCARPMEIAKNVIALPWHCL